MNSPTKSTTHTHPNQPGVTIDVEVMASGHAWEFDSREAEGRWLGGRTGASNRLAILARTGWTVSR